jgi:hypothetical protein
MIKNKKVFRIDENEKARILGMHQTATKSMYLSEQSATVEGTLMTAQDDGMMGDLMDMVKDTKQVFTIGNTEGDVKVPNVKMLKPTDKIVFNGEGSLLVYPQSDMDAQFLIKPKNGKLMLFRGA